MPFPLFLYYRPTHSIGDGLNDIILLNSCLYKDIIDCFDRCFKVIVAYPDDDVKLTRSLIDHLDIDIGMC